MIAAGPDLTPGFSEGWLRSVAESEGVGLVGDHPAGATVLAVSSLRFADTGDLTIAGVTYAYARGDETLTINPGLASAQESGASVIDLVADEPSSALVARVDLDMDGDPDNDVTATIAGELAGFYTVGDYPPGVLVTVADTPTGYEVKGRPTDAPALDPVAIYHPRITLSLPADVNIPHNTTTHLPTMVRGRSAGFGLWSPREDGSVRIDRSGEWRFELFADWAPSSNGHRVIYLERFDFGNNMTVERLGRSTPADNGFTTTHFSDTRWVNEGDWVRMTVRQSSGATLAVKAVSTTLTIVMAAPA